MVQTLSRRLPSFPVSYAELNTEFTSADFYFPGTVLSAENAQAISSLHAAAELMKAPENALCLDETLTRRVMGDIQAELICDLHKIEYYMSRRGLLLERLNDFQRILDASSAPPAVPAAPPA